MVRHFCRPILTKFLLSPQPLSAAAALMSSCCVYKFNDVRTNNNNIIGKRNGFILFNSSNNVRLPSRPTVRMSQHLSNPTVASRPTVGPKVSVPYLRIATESEAHELVYFLKQNEREILHKVLTEHIGVKEGGETNSSSADGKIPMTKEQAKTLFLCNALPFIGFGILDNLLMILAGEYIDNTLGLYFHLSTMAAAGLGNILSDIAGVGSAHYVEYLVAKFFNLKPPPLTAEQWDSGSVRWTTNAGRCIGLVIGCLIGMFPLLFFDETGKQEKKLQAKAEMAATGK